MASHSLAIAKASLAASLMRPEPSPVPRADIAHFHRLVDTLLSQCTVTNIQLCKDWLLKNTTSSPARTGAVGKYLVALSASLASPRSPNRSDQAKAMKPSNKRRQLSILYLLHDVLHHTKFHCPASAETAGSDRMLEPYVMQLVALTSAHEPTKHAQHIRKLKDLIDIWSAGEYYPSPLIAALRMTVNDALNGKRDVLTGDVESLQRLGTLEEAGSDGRRAAPYVMPPAHGDNSVPYYDLPAGDLMPCIVPNSTTPIDPRMVKPLEFRAGPADEGLVQAVKSLLQDAATIYGTPRPWYEMEKSDIDELGQLVIQDEFPREASVSEGYYGWSRAFCERMKLRNKRGNVPRHPHRYEYTSTHMAGKRRYSGSGSSRSRSSSRARSRSPAQGRKTGRMEERFSDSYSRSRSRSRPGQFDNDHYATILQRPRSQSSRSRSRSYSPPDVPLSRDYREDKEKHIVARAPHDGLPHAIPPPPSFLQQGYLGAGQMPIPPPRPPNYHGPWPPPPPPPPTIPAMSAPTFPRNPQVSQTFPCPPFGDPSAPPPPPPPAAAPSVQDPRKGTTGALYGQSPPQFSGQIFQGHTRSR